MSSENFVSFPFLYLYFSCLTVLIGIYCAVLTGIDNSGLPAHVSDFKGNTLHVSSWRCGICWRCFYKYPLSS